MISDTSYTLTPTPQPTSTLREGETSDLDWDKYISIELIRLHTKTDNVPGVTDEQLRLYRAAAIEAAEFYTGMMLKQQKVVNEVIPMPRVRNNFDFGAFGDFGFRNSRSGYSRGYFTVKLKYPSSDGIIYLYGGGNPNAEIIHVTPDTRTVRMQSRFFYSPDMSNCCNPCSIATNSLKIMYRSGFSCPETVPAGIRLGVLQFVAWIVEHPGDEILAMRNTLSARGGALIGTNNIALVSGALESWRQYDTEAI